ncbi:MAG TPA: ATPase, partial [Verrucomicrobiae bacterium]|nr:ATPase [Verrucomicrobiae bacterium]
MSAVIVSLRVKATPAEAFDVFTQEIGLWWRPNGLFQLTPRGDGVLSFENQERLITTLPNGKVFEIGRVTT